MTLVLVHSNSRPGPAPVVEPSGSPDDEWGFTPWLDVNEEGDDVWRIEATHHATGLSVKHDTMVDAHDWVESGTALRDLAGGAIDELTGLAIRDAKVTAHAALVVLGYLWTSAKVDLAEYPCECGGFLAEARTGLVHVDVCGNELDGDDCDETGDHRICLDPAPRHCGHSQCTARARVNGQPCELGEDCCISCCHGEY